MRPYGRESELTSVTARLRDRRLITLVGPGGIGKTTLARLAAEDVGADFERGVHVVDLSVIDTPDQVDASFAAQLGFTSFQALLDAPTDESALLVVDGCEHVLDAAADAVERLLDACEMPTVLATSRSALEVPGEVVIPLGPLALPPPHVPEGPAVELFLARAGDAGSSVGRTEAVGELCRRLDGVPLAIELAAVRTRSLTAEEILERLGAGLDVLDRPRRRGTSRHQGLQATIDWSFSLLAEDEQRLLARLGVFAGPFTAVSANAVAADPDDPTVTVADMEDGLHALVLASMVVAQPDGTTTSYRLLDTIRARALDHLDAAGERHRLEARFVDHVVDRATGIIARGASGWSPDALRDLYELYGNISGAVRWCLDHDAAPDRALVLVAVLWGVTHQAHTEEVDRLAEATLARWPDVPHPFRADAVATWATSRYMLGDTRTAIDAASAALLAAKRSPFARATLWRTIAQARRVEGDTAGALDAFEVARGEALVLGQEALAQEAECARAQIMADVGQVDDALALVRAVRAAAVVADRSVSATWARTIEGSILLRHDAGEATAVLDEAVAEARRIGYFASVSVGLRALALASLTIGDVSGAARHALGLLDHLLDTGSTLELRSVLDVAAPTLAGAGRHAAARDLAATALSLPVVSITASVGHELFPLDGDGGRVLSVREAIVLTRAELGALITDRPADGSGAGSRGASDLRAPVATRHSGVLRRLGDTWEVGWEDELVTLRASKGLADLRVLLAAPGRERHCLALIGGAVDEDGTGPVLDATARRAYEERVRELQADIDEADADHDAGRADQARLELDALVDQLTEALGLGARARSGTASSAERARSAVTQRIRATMRRIDEAVPRLGRHLRASVRTGTFCSYEPEEPVEWRL